LNISELSWNAQLSMKNVGTNATWPAESLAPRGQVAALLCYICALRLWDYIARRRRVSLAARPWTVDAILNIDTLSDPQIRPDGRSYAWVSAQHGAHGVDPGQRAKGVASGTRPRWSPDSSRLAYLIKQVHVLDLKSGGLRVVTHSPSPVTSYCWTADGRGIAYLAVDTGPAPDRSSPIVTIDTRVSTCNWRTGASRDV